MKTVDSFDLPTNPICRMRKTIVFSWIFPLNTTSGGIERVTRRLIDELTNRGYTCHFLMHDIATGRFLYEGKDVGNIGEFLRRIGADTVVNQNGYSRVMTDALDAANWSGRYVVCHHNEPFYLRKLFNLPGVIGQIRAPNKPIYVRLTWLVRLLVYPLWQWISTNRIARTQARNYRRADRYVVLSRSFLQQLSMLLGQVELPKAVAIPNPLSFEVAPAEAVRFKKRHEVLMVARLHESEKRISAALNAWRLIENLDRSNWILRIVGDGPDAEFLQKRAQAMGLKHVTFEGRQDPFEYYKSASIFLMTSRVEGWGLTLTEAMQTGAVPVAFDAYASLSDIIEDGETGILVKNGAIAELADTTLRLIRDTKRRQRLAVRAVQSVQKYRIDCVLDQWEAIL
jgi:glycosyltransferase involved in cell wall biosynthesis